MNCLHNYLKSYHVKSERPAIVFFKGLDSLNNSTSFKELYHKTLVAQQYLKKQGYKRGDALMLFEAPTANLYAFILASLGLGVRLLIVEPWMSGKNINNILKKIKPKGLMTSSLGKIILLKSDQARRISHKFNSSVINNLKSTQKEIQVEEMDPDDHAILTFTSGTSGNPKGVHRKHQYLIDQASVLKKYLNYDKYQKLDLTVFTNVVLLNLTLGKGSLIIPTDWKSKYLSQLDNLPEQFQVDTTACGPAFLHKLLNQTKTLKIDSFHIGGALADIRLYEKVIKRWPNAVIHHVYGSTEAEPVALSNLKEAVEKSKSKGYFQTLYLGFPIEEIQIMEKNGSSLVSGKHVSPMYENDDEANKKNKYLDEGNTLWHNMGDRLIKTDQGLFYNGRSFQTKEEFKLEQDIYSYMKASHSFIKNQRGNLILYGKNVTHQKNQIKEKFPQLHDIIEKKIIRDPRHKARIDRELSFEKGDKMQNIIQFVKERVPILPNIILCTGILFSCSALLKTQLEIPSAITALAILFIFIVELRFMDELKDYEKDLVAHPERPLPRGLISKTTMGRLINGTLLLFTLLIIPSYFLAGSVGALLHSIVVIWLFLMYKEFFIEETLAKSPIVYALSHQLIIFPLCITIFTILKGQYALDTTQIGASFIFLSSFFTYEVGRKMDPNANKILGTYLVHYGKLKTHFLITTLAAISVLGAYMIDMLYFTLIPFILIVVTQIRNYRKETIFDQLEGIIALTLIYNMWFIAIKGWFL